MQCQRALGRACAGHNSASRACIASKHGSLYPRHVHRLRVCCQAAAEVQPAPAQAGAAPTGGVSSGVAPSDADAWWTSASPIPRQMNGCQVVMLEGESAYEALHPSLKPFVLVLSASAPATFTPACGTGYAHGTHTHTHAGTHRTRAQRLSSSHPLSLAFPLLHHIPTQGKGRGVVATRDFKAGEVVMATPPLALVTADIRQRPEGDLVVDTILERRLYGSKWFSVLYDGSARSCKAALSYAPEGEVVLWGALWGRSGGRGL